ncbi:MAG: hypothetical protein P4L99_25265 [Chthoniobacter sp.]|nr:hypothetical protein [Chthoniobacter sp.]
MDHAANYAPACDFFEGVVMKRADSIYPVQCRNAMQECRVPMKVWSLSLTFTLGTRRE